MHSIEIKEKEDKTFEILNDGQPIVSGSGGSLPEVEGSGKSLVSVNGEWKEQDGYGYVKNVERQYIVPEQNITLKTNYQKLFYIDWSIGLEENAIYEVVFDGSSYELEGWKFDDPGWNNQMILGEAEIAVPYQMTISPKFDNYPFCLTSNDVDYSTIIYFTDCEPHNVKIINKSTSEILLDVNNISGSIYYTSNSSASLPNVFESGKEYQININDDSYSIVYDDGFFLDLAESGNKCIDIWNSSYGYDDVKYLSVEYRIDKEITLPATLTIKDGDEILYNKKIFSNLLFGDYISESTTIPYSVALCNFDETSTSPQIVEVNIDGDVYKTQINHGGDVFYGGADFIPISGSSEIGYEVDFSNYPFFFYVDLFTAEQPQIVFFMSNENGNEHTISIYTETEEIVGIDKKYLPDGIGYTEDVVEIITETVVTQMDGDVAIGEIIEPIPLDMLDYRHTYSIEFDGVVYELPPVYDAEDNAIEFGVLSENSLTPFGIIIYISDRNPLLFTTEAGEHTISIKYNKEHKISERFLTPRIWLDVAQNQETGENYIINNSGLSNAEIYNSNISSILVKDPNSVNYHVLTLRQYDRGSLVFDEGNNSSMKAILSLYDMNWILEYIYNPPK